MNYGTCFDSQCPWDVIFKEDIPEEAFTTAKRFRIQSAFKVNNFDELGTALYLGFPVVSGIAINKRFNELDSEFSPPIIGPDEVTGGHALCHVGIKYSLHGYWLIDTMNSWSDKWGDKGYCYLKEEHWNEALGYGFDSFAIQSVIDDPVEVAEDTPNVPYRV
jgi:hypothetical protein